MIQRLYRWFDRHVLELGRELRLSYSSMPSKRAERSSWPVMGTGIVTSLPSVMRSQSGTHVYLFPRKFQWPEGVRPQTGYGAPD